MLHIKEFQTAGDDIQHGGRQRANFKLRDCQAFDVMGDVLSEKPGDLQDKDCLGDHAPFTLVFNLVLTY
jgi:hypothetical protein